MKLTIPYVARQVLDLEDDVTGKSFQSVSYGVFQASIVTDDHDGCSVVAVNRLNVSPCHYPETLGFIVRNSEIKDFTFVRPSGFPFSFYDKRLDVCKHFFSLAEDKIRFQMSYDRN